MAFDPDTTVGDLVAARPSRSRVLDRYGIDYCCGGQRTLEEAARESGVAVEELTTALADADAGTSDDEPDLRTLSLAALIRDITGRHHAFLREELPRLTELTAMVHRAHGENHPELAEVETLFADLRAELENHLEKEEQVLFPMIESMEASRNVEPSHCGSVRNPIGVMEDEHDGAAAALSRLRALTGDFTPPADGCNAYRALMAGLVELEHDLHRHIHKENSVLFPRATALEAELIRAEEAGA